MTSAISKYLLGLEEFEEGVVSEPVEENQDPIDPVTTDVIADEPIVEAEPMDGEFQPLLETEDVVDSDEIIHTVTESDQLVNETEEQYDNAVEATVALEAYASLLKKCQRDGISQETANFMRIGVGLAERHLGGVTLGLEEYPVDGRSSSRVAAVSYEDFKEKLKAARDWIIEMFKKLYAAIIAKAKNVASGLDKVEKASTKLGEFNLAKKSTDIKEDWDGLFERKATSFEYADGSVVKDLSKVITGVVYVIADIGPTYNEDILGGLEGLVTSIDPNRNSKDDVIKSIGEVLSSGAKLKDFMSKLGDSPLPGDYTLVQKDEIGAILFQAPKSPSKEELPDYEITNLDVNKVIKTLAADITRLKSVHAKVISIDAKIKSLGSSAQALLTKTYDDESSAEVARLLASEIQKVSKSFSLAVYDNIKYAVQLMATQLKICEDAVKAKYK